MPEDIGKDIYGAEEGGESLSAGQNSAESGASPEPAESFTWADGGEPGGDAPEAAPGQGKSAAREIFDWLEVFSFALAAVVVIFTFLFRMVTVDGISMQNTLHTSDKLIISHLFYKPKTGDIAVLQLPGQPGQKPLIKRVIATEGQVVNIDFNNWKVTVDGVPLDEPYVNYEQGLAMARGDSNAIYPLTVEKGKVFVMGDNRNHSWDSRFSGVGQIDERYVVGRVLLRVFPFPQFGLVPGTFGHAPLPAAEG